MSKELTEQYRDGTLPCGFYYFTNGKEIYPIHHQQVKGLTGVKGVGVVGKVPTYDQFVELTEKANQFSQMVKKVEELVQKVHILNEANMTLENAIGSQADYFRQQISVLEDRVKELEIQIGAYESCLALMPDSFEGVEK